MSENEDDPLPDNVPDAALPGEVAEGGNVLKFRPPSVWPHAWNSKTPWRETGWNSKSSWSGAPRVLIIRGSGADDDDPEPPMAA